MSRVREATLTSFVTYLTPLKPKAYAAKIDFFKNLSFKIAMSWPAGVGSPEVYLFIDLLKNQSIMLLGISRHFFLLYDGFLKRAYIFRSE